MTNEEWFLGVLGWNRNIAYPPIHWAEDAWIEHVVKPMREMGYRYNIRGGYFNWEDSAWDNQKPSVEAPIIDDNIFQASLDAAAQVPEVRERLDDYKKKRR